MELKSAVTAACVFLLVSFATGQDYLDFDPRFDFGLANTKALENDENDLETFYDQPKLIESSDQFSEDALLKLCNEYDVYINEEVVECNTLKLVQKSWDDQEKHTIKKRSLDGEQVLEEGSGNGDDFEETENKTQDQNETVTEPRTVEDATTEKIDEVAKEEKDIKNLEESSQVFQSSTMELTTLKVSATSEDVKSPLEIATPSKEKIQSELDATTEAQLSSQVTEAVTLEDPAANKESPAKNPSVPTIDADKFLNTPEVSLQSSSLPKELEQINEQQSNTAVVTKLGKSGDSLAENEASIGKMMTKSALAKASLSSSVEEPKSGESKTSAESGSDNKVLICLFVGVAAVGVAAFVFKKVRDRRNAARPVATTNGLQQQPTDKQDLEQGQEMKPLMKSTDKPVAEFKDETENGKATIMTATEPELGKE